MGNPLLLLFFLSLFMGSNLYGAQGVGSSTEPVKDIFLLDKTHAVLSRSVDGAAKWFDGFFTTPKEQIESAYSYILFRNIFQKIEGQDFTYNPRVKAKVHFPGLERKASLIIQGDDRDDFKASGSDAGIDDSGVPLEENSRNRSVSVQYVAKEWVESRLDFKVGFRSKLRPQASARYRKDFKMTREVQLRFTQTGFWKYESGWGETSRFDFEKQLNPLLLLRWSNFGTYSEISTGLDFGSDLKFSFQISKISAINFDFGASGATRPHRTFNNYRIGSVYRRNFFREWLFYEVEPAVTFPRTETGRISEASITFRLEIQFRETIK